MSKIRTGRHECRCSSAFLYFVMFGGVNRLFAMIRELPSPLMFAFIGEQAGFGASHLSDSSRVSVVKQPNHLPFALGRICFRPWSKAFSTLVKSLFD